MNQQTQQPARRRAGILGALQSGLTQPTPPRVSIKAQRFTLVDGAGVQIPVQLFDQQFGMYIDVVIIGVNEHKSKVYFEYEYDPNNDDPPTCWSDNGVGPSSQSSKPQHPTCMGCPNNDWGSSTSKLTGKGTKLCADKKKMAVVVVNDPSQLVYQFQIPPASLKNVSVLAQSLQTYSVPDEDRPGQTRPCDPADVVTRIYFNPAKQGELLFQPMGFWTQTHPYIGDLIARADASNVISMVTGENDTVWSGAIAPRQIEHQQPQMQPMPQTQLPPPQPQFQQPQAPQQQYAPAPQMPGFPQPQAPQAQQFPEQKPATTRRGGRRAGAGRPGAAPGGAPAPQQVPHPQGMSSVPIAPQPQPFVPQMQQPQAQPMQMRPAQPAPQQAPFMPPPQQAAPQQAGGFPEMPGFLQRPAEPAPQQQPMQSGAAPQQPGGAYGMHNGMAPPADLEASLTQAFGAPMQPRQRG